MYLRNVVSTSQYYYNALIPITALFCRLSTATCYGLDGPGFNTQCRQGIFFSPYILQTLKLIQPRLMDTPVLPRDRAVGPWLSPSAPSSAEIRTE